MIFDEIKDFTIIDTETTGLGCYSKLVEFAAMRIRNGKPEATFNVLVNPKMIMSDEVIKIHKITNEMVQNAPTIDEVSKDIYEFIGDDILVAHNAPFDMDVLNRRLLFGLKNKYIDSLSIFRNSLNLPSYKLDNIRLYFNITIKQTHRALDDVNMLYSCLKMINKPYEIEIRNIGQVRGSCRATQIIKTKTLGNELENCHCVVTGIIPNMARNELWQIIVNHGGLVGSSVIRKTRYLVLGAENVGNSKIYKAKQKIAAGDLIEILSYKDFFKKFNIL